MFLEGDIIRCFAPSVGYDKYFLFIKVGTEGAAHKCLFLNSDPNYLDSYVVDCGRMPMLPPSDTGKTAFSLSMVPRYTDNDFKLYGAKKLGELPPDIAKELLAFVDSVTALGRADKAAVKEALTFLNEKNAC